MTGPDHRDIREILVRRASPADIAVIMKLAAGAPTAAQWSDAAYFTYRAAEHEPSPRMREMFVAYAPEDPPSSTENIVGFAAFSALAHADAIECELDNMVVAQDWRRRGIGRQLLTAGWRWLDAISQKRPAEESAVPPHYGKETESGPRPTIWLEVRAGNTDAIAFYRNVGFTITGRRPSYYSQPIEDAISMRKIL